ncbi:MAG: YjbH domain-containing protein [Pseudomonadota bacterium]
MSKRFIKFLFLLLVLNFFYFPEIYPYSLITDLKKQLTFDIGSDSHKLMPLLTSEGYSGAIFSPTGEVYQDGQLGLVFNTAVDTFVNSNVSKQYNFTFGIGFLPRLELGFRLADSQTPAGYEQDLDLPENHERYIRDLSANCKMKIIKEGYYLPALAFGVQDFGGASELFNSYYLAMSKTYSNTFRFTSGYGFGPDRLKGFFSSIETSFLKSIYIQAEYDTEKFNAGLTVFPFLKFIKEHSFLAYINGKYILSDIWNNNNHYWGVGLEIPLNERPIRHKKEMGLHEKTLKKDKKEFSINSLLSKLKNIGFENLYSRIDGNSILIEYENRIYPRSELDAIARMLSVLSEYKYENNYEINLIIKKQKIALLKLAFKIRDLLAFSSYEISSEDFVNLVHFSFVEHAYKDKSSGLINSSFSKSDFFLLPKRKYTVGTDLGIADIKLALMPEIKTPLFKGGLLRTSYLIPLVNTEESMLGLDYDYGFENLMYHQAFLLPFRVFNLTSFGQFEQSAYSNDLAIFNETSWYSREGDLKLGGMFGSSFNTSYFLWLNRKITNVFARYRVQKLDLDLGLEAGYYYYRDWGYKIYFDRFYGNTNVGLFYTGSTRGKEAGIMLSFPLCFKKTILKPWYIRPRFPDQINLSLRSQIFNPDIINSVASNVARLPEMRYRTDYLYFDNDKLTPSYIKSHLNEAMER